MTRRRKIALTVLTCLAGLSILAYLPFIQLPFISDDYVHIAVARHYAPMSGWADLAQDPLYRCRATSHFVTYWTERLFGLNPVVFNWSTVLLHILNAWLVFALGIWRVVGWRVSAVAAGFFAVYEGHQEAVVWYAALPELLVFSFILLTVLIWVIWLQERRTRTGLYYLAIGTFVLALFSKESGVATVPLLALAMIVERVPWKRGLCALAPFALLACAYAGMIFSASQGHLFFSDGTFSPGWQFFAVWPNSLLRLFRIWGAICLVTAWVWWTGRHKWVLPVAVVWMTITLVPYSFLSYMMRVPSRHMYLASLGASLVVAKGLLAIYRRFKSGHYRWIVHAVAVVIVVHNVGYLWTKKQAQYKERAAPTEALIDMVSQRKGPVYVHCFPYGEEVAHRAVEVGAGLPGSAIIWAPQPGGARGSGFSLGWNPNQHVSQPGKSEPGQPAAEDWIEYELFAAYDELGD